MARQQSQKQNNDLFVKNSQAMAASAPLADRMRPDKLEDFVGQEKLLGKGQPLRRLITSGEIRSLIFWGPPGCGKTTLARLIARYTKAHFSEFSAVTAGVADVRQVIKEAEDRRQFYQKKTILFVDEIHRFNKAQQDAFLPCVENGTIILIGATTENPAFEVNAPLISRSQVFVFQALSERDVEKIIQRAVKKYYPQHQIEPAALNHLAKTANGDARNALNFLESATQLERKITLKIAENASQHQAIYYDKKGDWHYDIISAFIKSLRGSDPDAAVYWLARMLEAGEDPMFIARRMVILASEDIGNANPNALVLATSTMQAVHMVGLPEARIILSQAATYLASSPKSNAGYLAINQAQQDVKNERLEGVPLHLRNAPTDLAKKLDYGKGYQYPHNFAGGFVEQQYLPDNLINKIYYQPKEIGKEAAIKKHLEFLRPGRYRQSKKTIYPKNLGNN